MHAKLSGDESPLSTVTPCLVVHECEKAIAFYERAFGATEVSRLMGPEAKYVVHAVLRIGDSSVLVAEATPHFPPTASIMVIEVEDCEKVFREALACGAKTLMPPTDKFYGARSGQVVDPFGQRWTISTQKEHLSAAELAERTRAAMLESATSD
jgi:PhnB protein